ncbi:MAG: hypothetical protein IMY86_06915 [Chloroflexi bacterium]|nr:hypothetical protein [Chloroflexota bacterium]
MAKDRREKSVVHPAGARRLLEGRGEDLADDERALLLALIEVDAESLNERELAALDKLKEQVEGYDTEELAQAVKHMVTTKPRQGRKLEWPELRQKLRQLSRRRSLGK